MQYFTIESGIAFPLSVIGLECNGLHSFVFADFRRLAVKKELASSKKSFSVRKLLITNQSRLD